MRQRREQRLVEQLIAQPPIEALDKGILLRLAGRDVMPLDAVPLYMRPQALAQLKRSAMAEVESIRLVFEVALQMDRHG